MDIAAASFDNRFLQSLPGEAEPRSGPHQVLSAAWSPVQPTPVAAPQLLAWSQELGADLGLTQPVSDDDAWVQALAGNRLLPGMQPYAACYGGHQFGHWAGQLGDGRVINLGQRRTPTGELQEMQLKGAGPTPYSRTADGRAVLRSSLREFICSEAMHHLGVPTTRALSLIATGDAVMRDMFYDGRAAPEPGAVVCRVAPSFIRFGTFELPAARGDHALLQQLVSYTINEHFPEFGGETPDLPGWFREVCERTARLMVDWQRLGFVHGVMNTDNMSIHGLSIDYGPYGWLEPYEPGWTPNTTDAEGRRYCFGNQPAIGQWNLACLAQALAPLVDEADSLGESLTRYAQVFREEYAKAFALKLGVRQLTDEDPLLIQLLQCMSRRETDYCITFRRLAHMPMLGQASPHASSQDLEALTPAFYSAPDEDDIHAWQDWLALYARRLSDEGLALEHRVARMQAVNPKYVPRNYLAQQAIEAAQLGDTSELETLQRVLRRPYDEQPEYEAYAERRPEWARHRPGCSALSCSS